MALSESAVNKLENRLRRSKDRRKVHYGDKTPVSARGHSRRAPTRRGRGIQEPEHAPAPGSQDGAAEAHEPGRIVRTKEHSANPMTVDDALYEMELVGHDFFLFR